MHRNTYRSTKDLNAQRRKSIRFGHAEQHPVQLGRPELKLQLNVLSDVKVFLYTQNTHPSIFESTCISKCICKHSL